MWKYVTKVIVLGNREPGYITGLCLAALVIIALAVALLRARRKNQGPENGEAAEQFNLRELSTAILTTDFMQVNIFTN